MSDIGSCQATNFLAKHSQEEEAPMPAETFLVAFHEGYWRVNFDGQSYGAYPNRTAAQRVTVVIAQAGDYLPTRVVVRDVDGTEEVVWDPDQPPADVPRGHGNVLS
jgi:hypothetical protein